MHLSFSNAFFFHIGFAFFIFHDFPYLPAPIFFIILKFP
ncbi:hypothetical protein FH5_03384 [Priestia endophytica]|nr:hypothetical protein FH5_03384 [Priestia endophytica]